MSRPTDRLPSGEAMAFLTFADLLTRAG